MGKLYELNKLEAYLKDNGYVYERIDESPWHDGYIDKHIVIVYEGKDENGNFKNRLWDAICHFGSYGYAEGLLEIYGNIVDQRKDGDVVVGHLTADDVIKRLNTDD